mgnify:CR=1 FL=1
MNIEITKEAALKLIGNDEKSFLDFTQNELAEKTLYHNYGVNIQTVHNYITGTTQYYIEDINA